VDALRRLQGLGLVDRVVGDGAEAKGEEDDDEEDLHEVGKGDPAFSEEDAPDVVLERGAEHDHSGGGARPEALRESFPHGLPLGQLEEIVKLLRHKLLDAQSAYRAHVQNGFRGDAAGAPQRLVGGLCDLLHVRRRQRDGEDDEGDDRQRDESELPRRHERNRQPADDDDAHAHGCRQPLPDERAHRGAVLRKARRQSAGAAAAVVVPADGLPQHGLERLRPHALDDALADFGQAVALCHLGNRRRGAHGHKD